MSTRKVSVKSGQSKRLRDFSIYMLISIICIGSILVAAVEGVPERKFASWFGFVLFTVFLFGQFISSSRRERNRRSFWLVTGLFFLAHVTTFTELIHTGGQITVGEWFLVVMIEMAVLILVRRLAFQN